MKLAGKTDVGLVRQDNQDDYRAGQLPGDAAWALVCDGMGGARGGREASQSACDVIERCFQEHYNKCLPGEEELFLKRTLVSANRFVFQKSIREESLAGMGTTAVCALVRSGKAYLCHAGDSRAYLFRDGSLAQLTHDHSYVQELVDCGTITVEEAEHHPQKNIITRALGVDYRLDPEFTSVAVHPGDILLLCSDGLTNAVPRPQLEQLLRTGSFYDLPDLLIRAANENGGKDNITALLLGVEHLHVADGRHHTEFNLVSESVARHVKHLVAVYVDKHHFRAVLGCNCGGCLKFSVHVVDLCNLAHLKREVGSLGIGRVNDVGGKNLV